MRKQRHTMILKTFFSFQSSVLADGVILKQRIRSLLISLSFHLSLGQIVTLKIHLMILSHKNHFDRKSPLLIIVKHVVPSMKILV